MKKIIFTILIVFLSGCQSPEFGAGEITAEGIASKYNTANEIKAKYQLDDVSLIKKDIKNAELDKYKGEPKDEIKVTIGDNTPVIEDGLFGANEIKEFKPDIELKRWNEVSFKLKTGKLLSGAKNKIVSFEGDKIKYKTDKMDFEMYAPDDENYKYVWYLNEKPEKNVVEFEIESSGLDFFYQPPLTQEYKNGYNDEFKKEIIVSETQVNDLDGNVLVERPENVVGSYAVYHSTKGGMNDINGKDYKTGQAFMIYRPHIIDANGKETWGNLHIENGIYSVEIPQEFLDKAVYPTKSNDTFGYTTVGSTSSGGINAASYAIIYPLSTNGDVTKLSIYFQGTNVHNVKGLIYNNSSSYPNALLDVSSPTVVPNFTIDWNDFNNSESLTTASYWLGWNCENTTGGVSYYYNAGDTNQRYYVGDNYSSPANPYPAGGTGAARIVSLYATYTPSGGGETTATPSAIFNANTIINSDIIIN